MITIDHIKHLLLTAYNEDHGYEIIHAAERAVALGVIEMTYEDIDILSHLSFMRDIGAWVDYRDQQIVVPVAFYGDHEYIK